MVMPTLESPKFGFTITGNSMGMEMNATSSGATENAIGTGISISAAMPRISDLS